MLFFSKRLHRVSVAKVAKHSLAGRNQGQSFRTIRGCISRPRVAVLHSESNSFPTQETPGIGLKGFYFHHSRSERSTATGSIFAHRRWKTSVAEISKSISAAEWLKDFARHPCDHCHRQQVRSAICSPFL
jgi:hypothetical protein